MAVPTSWAATWPMGAFWVYSAWGATGSVNDGPDPIAEVVPRVNLNRHTMSRPTRLYRAMRVPLPRVMFDSVGVHDDQAPTISSSTASARAWNAAGPSAGSEGSGYGNARLVVAPIR